MERGEDRDENSTETRDHESKEQGEPSNEQRFQGRGGEQAKDREEQPNDKPPIPIEPRISEPKAQERAVVEEAPTPPLPERRPVFPGEKPRGNRDHAAEPRNAPPAPEHVPAGPGDVPAPAPPPMWTKEEVEAGRNACHMQIDGAHLLYAEVSPLREGACGLPAPIELKAFLGEKGPDVGVRPSAVMSCKLAAALNHWIRESVQPEAKAKLDAAVVMLTNLSGYMCRNRYNDPAAPISEHAFGNAIDISGFMTAKGETISVEESYYADDAKGAFLRTIHDTACEYFGTTLGPDANNSHRNHFHLDVKERRHGLCDFAPGQPVVHRPLKDQQAQLNEKAGADDKNGRGKVGESREKDPAAKAESEVKPDIEKASNHRKLR